MSILIKKGRVVDPASGEEGVFDILIEGERIRRISGNIKVLAEEVIDAEGKVVIPGLVDMHVHARQPGREDEETIRSVTLAAARGGFTTICCMPNTTPVTDTPAVVEYIYREAEKSALVEVLVIGAITTGCRGKRLSEMGRLKKAGVVAFSDDGRWVVDSQVMRRALEYSKMLNLPVISHCEDPYLSRDGFVNEGYWSTVLGLPGIPSEAEEIAVFRDLALARLTGGKLHIAHVSCEKAVKLIREAKREKIKVTCEVTPHHLALSDEAIRSFNANTKVNPPLRTPQDIESLKMGLK
ncbi:dihydroorotase, partial [Candidatus Aerophobetes bacterium]|nr:dihydroorotase [Candidatus Aerophobetes bacterium]